MMPRRKWGGAQSFAFKSPAIQLRIPNSVNVNNTRVMKREHDLRIVKADVHSGNLFFIPEIILIRKCNQISLAQR